MDIVKAIQSSTRKKLLSCRFRAGKKSVPEKPENLVRSDLQDDMRTGFLKALKSLTIIPV